MSHETKARPAALTLHVDRATSWSSIVLISVLGLLPSIGRAQDAPPNASQQMQLVRDIAFTATSELDILRVPLDTTVFERARVDRHDMRVVDREGDDVPFVIQRRRAVTTRTDRQFWSVSNVQLKPHHADGLEIRFKLDEHDPQPQGLRIVTPLKDFEQTLQLFAVNGLDEVLLIESEVLFDYSKFMKVRRTELSIPANSAREFRLVIGSPTANQESVFREMASELWEGGAAHQRETYLVERRPFRVDRLELWVDREQRGTAEPVTEEYPVTMHAPRHDAIRKETRVRLSTRFAPLARLELEVRSKNFSRRVQVMAPDDNQAFTRIAGTTEIHRLSFGTLQQQQLSVPVSGNGQRAELELVIENRDSPPLDIVQVRGWGYVDEVIFFAADGERYQLVYAGRHTAPPDYDTAALQSVLAQGITPVLGTLGSAYEQPVPPAMVPGGGDAFWNQTWFIGSLIGLLVVGLGWALVRAAQRIDKLQPDSHKRDAS